MSYSSEYEWFLAAQWAGYKEDEFYALPGERQSRVIAAYKTKMYMEAVVSFEQAKDAQRAANRRRAKTAQKK